MYFVLCVFRLSGTPIPRIALFDVSRLNAHLLLAKTSGAVCSSERTQRYSESHLRSIHAFSSSKSSCMSVKVWIENLLRYESLRRRYHA